jgi:predicted dinucleotide-binding enzyme
MGSNLGRGWLKAGHQVVWGSRQPETTGDLLGQVSGARQASHDEAMDGSEVVVMAVPFRAVEPFARAHAAALRDKLVIDISNPFDHLPDNRVAGAEITADAIGSGARVVAAFKTNFWRTLSEPIDPRVGLVRDVLIAGDDESDKEIVGQLVRDLGFLPVNCGVLHNGRILDGMVPLIIELDRRFAQGEGRASWKLLA